VENPARVVLRRALAHHRFTGGVFQGHCSLTLTDQRAVVMVGMFDTPANRART
jgi:hypothetical protein